MTAGHVKVDRHPIAQYDSPDLAPHLCHLTCHLVSHDQRQDIQTHPPGTYFQVGAAHPDVAHSYQCFIRAYAWGCHVFEDQWTTKFLQQQGTHVLSFFRGPVMIMMT